MDEEQEIPPGMVRVPAIKGIRFEGMPLDDFYIDGHEVTNRQFKEFVDAGGYRKREY